MQNRLVVIGDGGWGTTLAILLSRKAFEVTLWSASGEYASYLNKQRINKKFLPDAAIPESIRITCRLKEALESKDIIIFAVPSQYALKILRRIKAANRLNRSVILVSVTKGIEINTLKRISELVRQELGRVNFAVLSGPTIAREVIKGIPTTAVIASYNKKIREYLQGVFMTPRFRVYTNDDVIGVELGGCLKNIIAIACGISDGLGFGANTKAALLARGMVEIVRLGVALGARSRTFSGISGLGDLVTTCISPHSRNRFVGEQIGKGKRLKDIITHMQMVAEGIPTAKSAYRLSLKHNVDMPITKEVYTVLYKNKSPLKAVNDLMTRQKKDE